MRQERGFIINVLAVLMVLGIVFLSQQTHNAKFSIPNYQFSNWIGSGGEELQNAVLQQKDAAAKNIWERIKSYFAEKFSKFSGTKVE